MKMVYGIALLLLLVTPAAADSKPVDRTAEGRSMTPLSAPIHFFRSTLSAADGQRCPMTPSCSSYALEAMRRHGPIKGWIMACDRLIRCGHDELKRGPSVMTRQGLRHEDTVRDNDFWWR